MLEDAVESEGIVRFARRGQGHVRRRGEDARAGDVLLAEGTRLAPGAIALLASVGCVRPKVTRGLDILHVATALELGVQEFLTFDANQKTLAEAEGFVVPF